MEGGKLRIISGSFKGRKLFFKKIASTRPLRDLVRENIFNTIKHSSSFQVELKNANVLDLYSGSGSFGLECLSRGASFVSFVEKNKMALNMIQKNLELLNLGYEKYNVYNNSVEVFLQNLKDKIYNIFFFDPPYDREDFIKDLILIKKKNFFTKKNLVIIHRESKKFEKFSDYLEILSERKYGRSKITFGRLF